MAEIKSFDNPGEKNLEVSPIEGIFSLLKPLDKFTKSALLLFVLILISLPFFLNNYFDTRQRASTQTPLVPLNTITVKDIRLSYSINGTNKNIYGTIKVIDGQNLPLSQTYISMVIKTPSGSVYKNQITTNSLGEANYTWRFKEKGAYILIIDKVMKYGYVYSPTVTTKTLLVN